MPRSLRRRRQHVLRPLHHVLHAADATDAVIARLLLATARVVRQRRQAVRVQVRRGAVAVLDKLVQEAGPGAIEVVVGEVLAHHAAELEQLRVGGATLTEGVARGMHQSRVTPTTTTAGSVPSTPQIDPALPPVCQPHRTLSGLRSRRVCKSTPKQGMMRQPAPAPTAHVPASTGPR